MKETDLWDLQCQHMVGLGTRIENAISSGVFDSYWTGNSRGVWIENKIQRGNQIKVRGTQLAWGMAHLKAGANNLYFMVVKDRLDLPRLYAAQSIFAHCDLNLTDGKGQMLVNLNNVGCLATGWDNIQKVLLGT